MRIVVIADIVMSLDNVIAIAAAAELAAAAVDPAHAAAIKATLIIFGLATSVPLIIAGSAILMALLHRFRVLVWGGGALLGWVAGDIMSTDPMVVTWFGEATAAGLHAWGGRVGSLIVVCAGLWIVRSTSAVDVRGDLDLLRAAGLDRGRHDDRPEFRSRRQRQDLDRAAVRLHGAGVGVRGAARPPRRGHRGIVEVEELIVEPERERDKV